MFRSGALAHFTRCNTIYLQQSRNSMANSGFKSFLNKEVWILYRFKQDDVLFINISFYVLEKNWLWFTPWKLIFNTYRAGARAHFTRCNTIYLQQSRNSMANNGLIFFLNKYFERQYCREQEQISFRNTCLKWTKIKFLELVAQIWCSCPILQGAIPYTYSKAEIQWLTMGSFFFI